jgi:uncharacterized membrane protein
MATSSGSGLSLETDSLTAVHWVGVVLALISGVIHLVLGISIGSQFGFAGLGGAFVLAGLGFFGAVVLLLVDYRRRLVYAVGVPFVGIQIVVWLWSQVINSNRPLGTPDYVDKAAQVILVVILLYLLATEE